MSAFLKRWWWALLVVAVGLGLCRLRFDVDVLDLLPPDEPTVQGLKLYQQHFTNARELVMTLRAPDADTAERLSGQLAARLRQATNLVADATWQPPWMERPDQLGELLAWLWFNQPPADFADLTNRLAPEKLQATLDDTRELLATSMSPMDLARHSFDPFNLLTMPALTNLSGMSLGQGQQMFTSTNGTYHLLYLQSAVDLTSYRACESWLQAIRSVVAEVQSGPAKEAWKGVVVRYTGRPVFVDNDATMALVAEARVGAGAGADNLLMLTIGTGIGGAAISGGKILRGAGGAGQFGHITIAYGGAPCACGRLGCLETTSSGTALRRLIDATNFGPETTAASLLADDSEHARALLLRWAGPLREGIDSYIAAFDPDRVILGGGLGAAAAAAVARIPGKSPWFQRPVVAARLGDSAGVIGAGLAALDAAR